MLCDGFHVRRQVPIDHSIVDFACYSVCLLIEADSGQHNFDEALDTSRALRALAQSGSRVLRFWNHVQSNTEGVEEAIRNALARRPHPNPSPQEGGTSEWHGFG